METKLILGRRAEAAPEAVKPADKAGPLDGAEVEGQAVTAHMQCPWCGGVNRVLDPGAIDVWSCAWCGNLFN